MPVNSLQSPVGIALAQTIRKRGIITFADFMQIALYDPACGYYTNPDCQRIGWEGDFITSVDLHPLFGAAIGRFCAHVWQSLDCPNPFIVHEDGAARGFLARDIFAWATESESDAPAGFADALCYQMADIQPGSPSQRIWSQTLGHTDTWPSEHTSPIHCLLTNELIDAFPVHLIELRNGEFHEIYVDAIDDPPYLTELTGPISDPAINEYLAAYGIARANLPDGWRGEINLAADTWIANAAQRIVHGGTCLTIDYGDTAQDLYTAQRSRGTLVTYYQHHLSDRVFEHIGEQDLTAHVNFSALMMVGKQYGLRTTELTTQREFLLSHGIREDMDTLGHRLYPEADSERHTDRGQIAYLRRSSLYQAINALIDPSGLGGFKVLIQQKEYQID